MILSFLTFLLLTVAYFWVSSKIYQRNVMGNVTFAFGPGIFHVLKRLTPEQKNLETAQIRIAYLLLVFRIFFLFSTLYFVLM